MVGGEAEVFVPAVREDDAVSGGTVSGVCGWGEVCDSDNGGECVHGGCASTDAGGAG